MGIEDGENSGALEKKVPRKLPEASDKDVVAVAASRRGFGGNLEEDRVADEKRADEGLEEDWPLDVDEITIVDPDKTDPDRRIVKLKDGTLGIYHPGKETIYIEGGRKMGGRLIEYDAKTGERVGYILASMLKEKPRLAYEKLKKMNDKLHPQPAARIDVDTVKPVKSLRGIPDRYIVELADGTLAIENTLRRSYLVIYGENVVEYDSSTGEKGQELPVSKLTGKSKEAYEALKKLKRA